MKQKTLQEKFKEKYPDSFYLTLSPDDVIEYLDRKDFLLEDEEINFVEKAGQGNMNIVVRVNTNRRSFVIKQARPWVEKYPQIPAPVERSIVESTYFAITGKSAALHDYSPFLLANDPPNFIMILSDLGHSSDYTYLYETDSEISDGEINELLQYLKHLHGLRSKIFPANMKMRQLNHQHIFQIPFSKNDLNLDQFTPGLQEMSKLYKDDKELKNKVAVLGDLYLSKGSTLIHGDFYPGSWLKTEEGLKIIDPEFSFLGPQEYDYGIFLAHLLMARKRSNIILLAIEKNETKPELVIQFAGTEILRRILGVAQLPLTLNGSEKEKILKLAAEMVKTGKLKT